jgi:hypothetical protein
MAWSPHSVHPVAWMVSENRGSDKTRGLGKRGRHVWRGTHLTGDGGGVVQCGLFLPQCVAQSRHVPRQRRRTRLWSYGHGQPHPPCEREQEARDLTADRQWHGRVGGLRPAHVHTLAPTDDETCSTDAALGSGSLHDRPEVRSRRLQTDRTGETARVFSAATADPHARTSAAAARSASTSAWASAARSRSCARAASASAAACLACVWPCATACSCSSSARSSRHCAPRLPANPPHCFAITVPRKTWTLITCLV